MVDRKNVVAFDRPPDMSVFKDNNIRHVFVYGTLKRGFRRQESMSSCRFVAEDKLVGYLFDLGGFPAFIPGYNGYQVHGEVFTLPDDDFSRRSMLGKLDAIEGTPDLYYRYCFRTMKGHYAWAYWMPRDRIQDDWAVITDGQWKGAGRNTIQKWLDFSLADGPGKTGYGFPTKIMQRWDAISKAPACDMYMSTNADKPYLEMNVSDTSALAYIPFSIPKATAEPRGPKNVGESLPLKTALQTFFEKKKEPEVAPEDSTKTAPMVDLVWLHETDEKPEKATQQETGGI